MSLKTVLSILSILILSCVLLIPISGCGQSTTGSIDEDSPSANPELPLLDTAPHGPVETAYFALGCFWGADSQFGSIEGVIRTKVGYAGGTTTNPTYHNIGNYSETVQVDYDAHIVSYQQLLAAFWSFHDATYAPYSMQYRSAIFYTTERQQELANEYKQAEQIKLGKTIYTDIEPHTGFFVAEDYHQKYYLRQNSELVNELYAIYPNPVGFRDSTAVARLNGYAGGYGDLDTLKKNLDSFGLSESGKQTLLKIVEYGITPVCPAI
jgi:peptide-methionine (S)-S-oxide reductase